MLTLFYLLQLTIFLPQRNDNVFIMDFKLYVSLGIKLRISKKESEYKVTFQDTILISMLIIDECCEMEIVAAFFVIPIFNIQYSKNETKLCCSKF